MRFEVRGPEHPLRLVVSRRNLLTLLAKLDANVRQPGTSFVEIGDPSGQIHIHAEEDEIHYNAEARLARGEAPYAGPMHPREERVLRDEKAPILRSPNEYMNPGGEF